MVIPGFENAVIGLEAGGRCKVVIPPEEAYGERRDDLVLEIGRDELPGQIEPQPGMVLEVRDEEGEYTEVAIIEVGEETITLDANHELAGETLTFEIELVEIG
jgi:peptidylprolyl isomerase